MEKFENPDKNAKPAADIDDKFDFGGDDLEEINPEEVFEEVTKSEEEAEKEEKKDPLETPYMKKKEAQERLEEKQGEQSKNFEEAERGWEETAQEQKFDEAIKERIEEGKLKAEEDEAQRERTKKLREEILFGKKTSARSEGVAGEIEVGESKPEPKTEEEKVVVDMPELEEYKEEKKQKEEFEKISEQKVEEAQKGEREPELEAKPEKLSLSELDDRVHALWGAMDAVLQDAAAYQPTKQEKKAMQEWMKKGGEVEDWPLKDAVTAENYKERLAKYGIAEFIDPSKIKQHKDAYAVVSEQYKLYRDELEKRIRKAKLRQLEALEEEEVPKEKKKKEKEEAPEAEEVIEMEAELPPEGAEMPEELKKEFGEKLEVETEEAELEKGKEEELEKGTIEEQRMEKEILKKFKEWDRVSMKVGHAVERYTFRGIEWDSKTGKRVVRVDQDVPEEPSLTYPRTYSLEGFYKNFIKRKKK